MCEHERILCNTMPHHATLNHIMTQMQTLIQTLKMNAIAMRCPVSQQDHHGTSCQTYWHAHQPNY